MDKQKTDQKKELHHIIKPTIFGNFKKIQMHFLPGKQGKDTATIYQYRKPNAKRNLSH